jgi:hypothetical protein
VRIGNKIYKLLIVLVVIISACEKEEVKITLPARGNTTFMVIENLGKDFEKQGFFNLKDSALTLVDINSWDLCFDASEYGSSITINGGMDMYAAKTNSYNFFKTNNPDTFNYKWDAPCGCVDSLAIHNWAQNLGKVYILDRGAYYTKDRYIQIKFISFNKNSYQFEYASNDNPEERFFIELQKEELKAHVYFSFTTKNRLNFEPYKNAWDFCFIKYRHVFFETNPITKYVVRGIFVNNTKSVVAVDSSCAFESITPSYAINNCKYSNLRDAMGYDWKVYNFTTGQYMARTNVNYMIKDWHTDEIYKLRFLDFNNNGIKGTPKFEYLLLK